MSNYMLPLGEACSVITDGTHYTPKAQEHGRPFLTVKDMHDGCLYFENCSRISEADFQDAIRNGCGPQSGDVLFSKDGTVGKVHPFIVEEDCAVLSSVAILRPNRDILDQGYFAHFLRSEAFLRKALRNKTGSAIRRIILANLRNLEIPLPPLEEQRRIAAILDKASALKTLAFRQLLASEEAETYLFLDCLGSPFPRLTKWPVVRLSELGLLERGVSKHRPRNDPSLMNGPYPFIQTGDVAGCHRVIETSKSSYSEKGFAQSRLWPKGTLCITIAANIAKTGILGFEACFPDSVVGFQSGNPALTTYVQCWMGFLQKHIEKMAPESAQKNINLEILRELEIPLPDKEALKKFHDQVLSLRGHWIKQRSRHERLGELNCSLSSQLLSIHNT